MAKAKKPLPSLEWLKPRVRVTRYLCLAGFAALVVLLSAWHLLFATMPSSIFWLIFIVQLVPLAVVAPGVLQGDPRGHSWLCFVLNLYFIQGVLASFDPSKRLFGLLEVSLSFSLFVFALLFIRWTYQQRRKEAGEL